MKFQSRIETRGSVTFPPFMAEKVYMEEFLKKDGLPNHLAHWQETVDAMLDGVNADGPIYIMIDSAPVSAGKSHRRRGLHIDGYWNAGPLSAHSPGQTEPAPIGRHRPIHRPVPSPRPKPRPPVRKPRPGREMDFQNEIHNDLIAGSYGWRSTASGEPSTRWEESTFTAPEAIILASSLSAAIGYIGEFEGPIRDGGDCAHVDLTDLAKINMDANRVYIGNVTALHESLPVPVDGIRQLVRLNVSGWTI